MSAKTDSFLSTERRDDIRIHVDVPFKLTFLNPLTGRFEQSEGHVINLSQAGLTFSSKAPLKNIVVAQFSIVLPGSKAQLDVKGWILWEDLKKEVYGARFLEPSSEVTSLIDDYLTKSVTGKLLLLDRRRRERRLETYNTNGDDKRKQHRRRTTARSKNNSSLASFDRRLLIRIQTPLRAHIHVQGSHSRFPAQILSLSERGASVITTETIPGNVPELFLELELPSHPKLHLTTTVQWFRKDADGRILGGYFRDLRPEQEAALRNYLQDPLQNRARLYDRRLVSPIVSELIRYPNRLGKMIVGYHDHRGASEYANDPMIIIPSAYGDTKKDSIHISYYLVMNGFQVIRYDNTDHTGESEGDILNITLNKIKEDILATCDYAENYLKINKVGVVAASLAGRTAIKATAQDKRIVFLLGLVTAVDIQYTLNAVYCEDLIGTYKMGKKWGITNVLGHNTKLDDFLQDSIDNGFDILETTLTDAKNIHVPTILLAAEKDPWVSFQDVQQVLASIPGSVKEIHVVPALHQLKEDPNAARACFQVIAASANKYMRNREFSPREVKEPSMRELAIQNKLERQRARSIVNFEKKEEQKFWDQYLEKFHFIKELPDYQNLMAFNYKNVHEVHPGEALLDAGCGNGTFGLWVLGHLAWLMKKIQSGRYNGNLPQIRYVCLDFVDKALQECEQNHKALANQLFPERSPLKFEYHLADLDHPLSFAGGVFDKLVSNLVISYVRDPLFTLREMFRVLKPGGSMVITTLKSYADTSEIYRNYVFGNADQQRVEETRILLTNAGKIKQKETEGHFTFFSEDELAGLARQAEIDQFQVLRCFANQGNALIVRK